MPASEPTERGGAPEGEDLPEDELRDLEETVDRLVERMESLSRRAREAEEAHGELRRALARAEDGDDPDGSGGSVPLDERLRSLSQENERLRELLDRGRERAERLRKRLVLLEDES